MLPDGIGYFVHDQFRRNNLMVCKQLFVSEETFNYVAAVGNYQRFLSSRINLTSFSIEVFIGLSACSLSSSQSKSSVFFLLK